MSSRLHNKVALITGATGGIGSATAELFAREGAHLVVTDTAPQPLAELETRIGRGRHGGEVVTAVHDVASAQAWDDVLTTVRERFGRLDVLVNVAGVVDWSGVEATDELTWNRVIDVNQKGTWLGMRAAMPLLRASGRGSVINTSSVMGLIGGGGAAAYTASKGAVRLLSKTAAVEYARDNVRVNSVHPGVIATPMIQDILDEEGDQQPDIVRTPMARAGRADEIAPAMLFLASDESSFVTGSEIVVDGGLTAH
ncbi:SDR family NAD(P)-dependent oxidoreductase [Streptomyces daliensis]|uniref:Glucose 1-dehydrogenase n=1 Tax=Streptomyces daliensis TaxID=299421 RepID=A0A8T4IKR8_9ACTN|nr:glucose 1-dehydrogenase [Streptomyces daliensis]